METIGVVGAIFYNFIMFFINAWNIWNKLFLQP
jgi:hypothetical protein